jgi:hypothetical protein
MFTFPKITYEALTFCNATNNRDYFCRRMRTIPWAVNIRLAQIQPAIHLQRSNRLTCLRNQLTKKRRPRLDGVSPHIFCLNSILTNLGDLPPLNGGAPIPHVPPPGPQMNAGGTGAWMMNSGGMQQPQPLAAQNPNAPPQGGSGKNFRLALISV